MLSISARFGPMCGQLVGDCDGVCVYQRRTSSLTACSRGGGRGRDDGSPPLSLETGVATQVVEALDLRPAIVTDSERVPAVVSAEWDHCAVWTVMSSTFGAEQRMEAAGTRQWCHFT